MRIIHRCHTRSQCPIVCQVVTGVIPSSPYLALTLIFRFGATYVGASKIISMQVCGQNSACRELALIIAGGLPDPYWRHGPLWRPTSQHHPRPIRCTGLGLQWKVKIYLNVLCTDNLRTKMMVAIQEGKWQNVQITADYKVGSPKLLLNISLVCCSKLWTSKVTSFKRFLTGQRLHSFSHYWQPWPFGRHWNGRGPLPSGEKEEDFQKVKFMTRWGWFSFPQSVTPKLSVGAELAYQAAPQIPGGHIGVLSGVARYCLPCVMDSWCYTFTFRYAGSDFSMAGSISNAGSINATYFQVEQLWKELTNFRKRRAYFVSFTLKRFTVHMPFAEMQCRPKCRCWAGNEPQVKHSTMITV